MTYLKYTAAAVAALLPVSAFAQDEIVVTATGANQNIEQSGVSISVIDEALLQQRQTISVADILQDLPGVSTTQSGGFGTQTSIRIRGAEADQTLVLINGIRVNDVSAPDGSFDFGNLFANNIERIEVLRGANSVAWGSQAIGGVVHITTKRPTEELTGFAQAEYGASDTVRLMGGISGQFGPVGLALGGSYLESDGISAFSGGAEDDGYRQYAANGQLTFAITDTIGLEASAYYTDGRVESDAVFPPFSADSPQFSTSEEFYARVALNAALWDGRFKNRVSFALSDVNRDIVNPDPISGFTSRPRGRVERFEYQGDVQLIDMLRLVFGAETEKSKFNTDFDQDETGIDSLYLQAIVEPVDGLSITAGVRHDDHEDFGGTTNFAANLAYQTGENGPIIRASYAEGFRAPTLIDLDGSPFGFGTPDLQPETAKAYEIGIEKKFLDGAIFASINLFQRDTDNQIIFAPCPTAPDPAPAICTIANRDFGTTQNLENTRARGIEIILNMRPSDGFAVGGNYTYLDNENRSAGSNFGNRLARRPVHELTLNIDYQTPFDLEVGADFNLVGDSFDNTANSRRIDSYVLTGLRANMPIADNIEAFGRIDNLFDVTYETATDFGTFGRSAFFGARARF